MAKNRFTVIVILYDKCVTSGNFHIVLMAFFKMGDAPKKSLLNIN
jgi:hypothetical protein